MKNKFYTLTMIGTLAFSVSSCTTNEGSSSNKEIDLEHNTKFSVENMDTHVHPNTDFYNYSNGGWMKTAEIPSDEGIWGSFKELRDNNNKMTLALVDKLMTQKNIDTNSDIGKISTFFNSALNMEKRNNAGITPIQPLLNEVDALKTEQDVIQYIIEKQPTLSTMLNVGVMGDQKNSSTNALYMFTGNLGLPERDYYISDEEDMKEKRTKYVNHISRMFELTGMPKNQAVGTADRVLQFETKLAEAMLTKEDRRKPELTYNKIAVNDLNKFANKIDWKKFIKNIGATTNEVIVRQPEYLKAVNGLLNEQQLPYIKDYFKWVIINDSANYLTQEINDANFDFYGKTLRGVEEQKPLKERVLSTTNNVLGEALGKAYVKEYFPKEAKETAVEMVANLKRAYENRINELEWMSAETKVKAIDKLKGMNVKIGYPDKWKDYSSLTMNDNIYENILNTRKWNYEQDIAKVDKPVDKSEWFMSPQTVNAYYYPVNNDIVFPAAILQPPFFDYKADAAINYGGIGAVIGHEISHGFDDQGAKFDADGNLNNWWTETDFEEFNKLGKQLIAQYDAYEPLPGVFVNGEFTLGENIGDLGGVNSAYEALQIYLKEKGDVGEIDGLTQNQRFFISWATVWRTKNRDEALKNQIKTDPHSPGQYRAVGPLVNVDAFYEAFNIKEGDKMYKQPEERVKIW